MLAWFPAKSESTAFYLQTDFWIEILDFFHKHQIFLQMTKSLSCYFVDFKLLIVWSYGLQFFQKDLSQQLFACGEPSD